MATILLGDGAADVGQGMRKPNECWVDAAVTDVYMIHRQPASRRSG
jgi:hypothetical protein